LPPLDYTKFQKAEDSLSLKNLKSQRRWYEREREEGKRGEEREKGERRRRGQRE
jgi:hypothetical protein